MVVADFIRKLIKLRTMLNITSTRVSSVFVQMDHFVRHRCVKRVKVPDTPTRYADCRALPLPGLVKSSTSVKRLYDAEPNLTAGGHPPLAKRGCSAEQIVRRNKHIAGDFKRHGEKPFMERMALTAWSG